MRDTRRRNRRVVSITAALAVGLGSVGVAMATIPGSDGVISACYTKKGVRVIDSASGSCVTGESQLTWSSTGPQGPQGAPGAAGPQGPVGPAGPAGTSGISSVEVVTQLHDVANNSNDTAFISCPGTKHVIGGGYRNEDSDS